MGEEGGGEAREGGGAPVPKQQRPAGGLVAGVLGDWGIASRVARNERHGSGMSKLPMTIWSNFCLFGSLEGRCGIVGGKKSSGHVK